MQKIYVDQISDRDFVESVFLMREKTQAVAKNGKPYLVLKLIDKTGELEGRVWENADQMSAVAGRNDFVLVRGRASLYLGKMQLVVQEMVRRSEDEVCLADFMPVSQYPTPELLSRLRIKVEGLRTTHFRRLMEAFLDDADFLRRYSTAPAAKSMHHVFLGGLLEHSLAVADLAEDVCRRYPDVQRDLLIVGALLHDVGKIAELDYRRSFDYTDAGKLIGHIVLGAQMVESKICEIGSFPTQDALLLGHLLLSHHGQYEYGSPKRPKTLEAVILNFLDDLDSKINGVQAHIERDAAGESTWTSYHRLYDRYFFKGETAVEAESTAPERGASLAPGSLAAPQPRREAPLGVSLGDRLKDAHGGLFSETSGNKRQK